MADPCIIVLLVAAGGAIDTTTTATASSMMRALGPICRVQVRESGAEPTDAELLASAEGAHAAAAVELTWSNPDHRQALLRAHVVRTGQLVERTVGFRASDAEVDRGRTLGFAAASMLPPAALAGGEEAGTAVTSKDSDRQKRRDRPTKRDGEAPLVPESPTSSNEPAQASGTGSFSDGENGLSEGQTRHLVGLELAAVALTGIGGAGNAFGGAASAHLFAWDRLSLQAGVGGDAGAVTEAQASTLAIYGSVGVAVHPWRATPAHPLGLALRVDYVAMSEWVSRALSDTIGPATWSSGILSGFDAFVDASWLLRSNIEGILGLGVEDHLTSAHVNLQTTTGTSRVATVSAARAALEVGLRWRP